MPANGRWDLIRRLKVKQHIIQNFVLINVIKLVAEKNKEGLYEECDKFCLERNYTGLFISPSGISELDCTTTKTDTAERSISIGRESLQVFFVLGALAYFQVPPLGGSHEEKWRSQ